MENYTFKQLCALAGISTDYAEQAGINRAELIAIISKPLNIAA